MLHTKCNPEVQAHTTPGHPHHAQDMTIISGIALRQATSLFDMAKVFKDIINVSQCMILMSMDTEHVFQDMVRVYVDVIIYSRHATGLSGHGTCITGHGKSPTGYRLMSLWYSNVSLYAVKVSQNMVKASMDKSTFPWI
jgi:hypothetical protein